MKVFGIILHILVNTRVLFDLWFPSNEFFHLFLVFGKDGFHEKRKRNCCRKHVKDGEATSNTKIVTNMPAAPAAATSTFATPVIVANIIDQILKIFFPVGKGRPYWYSC